MAFLEEALFWRSGLKQLVDVGRDVAGLELFGVALEWFSCLVHQELFKVPGNVRPLDGLPDDELGVGHHADPVVWGQGHLALQPREHLVFPLPIHQDLVEHDAFWLKSISRPDILEGIENLNAVRVFLVAKLVGWEWQNHQLVSVLLAEFVHLREVTGGRSS